MSTNYQVSPTTHATGAPLYLGSVVQNEGHLHRDPVFVDLPVFHARFLLDHVKTGDAAQVLLARARPSWTAASKLVGEAAVIFDTLATAISASLVDWLPTRQPTCQYVARSDYCQHCQHYGRCTTERDRHSVRLAGHRLGRRHQPGARFRRTSSACVLAERNDARRQNGLVPRYFLQLKYFPAVLQTAGDSAGE